MSDISKQSVLWVDDHIDSFRNYIDALSNNGFDVSVASSIPEAIAKLEARPYDLIITDFVFAPDTAADFIKEAKDRSDAKIVVLSGYTHIDSFDRLTSDKDIFIMDKSGLPVDDDQIYRQLVEPLRSIISSDAGSLRRSINTRLPRLKVTFPTGSELIADFDTGLDRSFVSYEWLLDNKLIEIAAWTPISISIAGSQIIGSTASLRCIIQDANGVTKEIALNCFVIRDWTKSPMAAARANRVAILGRNLIQENNVAIRIDPSGELFFDHPSSPVDNSFAPLPETLLPPRRRGSSATEAFRRQNHVRLNGVRIAELRRGKTLPVREMAAKANISESTLRAAENGRWIKFETAGKIATALDTHFSNLVADSDSGERDASVLPPAETIPNAEPKAIQFSGGVDGPIDIVSADAPGEHLRDGPGQIEDFAEIRFKSDELNSLGSNRLGRAAGPIKRFLGLPTDIKTVRAKLFWSRANTLRILWQDHQEATKSKAFAGEQDERLLEAATASQLKDLVETINAFVLNDPVLMELDSVRPGPQDEEIVKEEAETLAPVLSDLSNNEAIATRDARDAVTEQLDNVGAPSTTLAGRQANEFARRSLRNFVGELLRRAYRPIQAVARTTKTEIGVAWKGIREGVYRTTGGALITAAATDLAGVTNFSGAFVAFVVRHAESLVAFVTKTFQNPQLIEIIHWIVRLGT